MARLPLCTSLLLGLLLRLVGGNFISSLQSLCGDMMTRPVTHKVQLICEDVSSFLEELHRENELENYGWLPSIRNSRDTSSAEAELHDQDIGARTRRGGNYIRFGRSVPSYSRSFGQRDTRGDGHYVRFGRSLPDISEAENLLHEAGKTGGHRVDDLEDKEKRFMRFGRDPIADASIDKLEEKRFMRFGKKDNGMGNGNKRFMRFGKREDGADATTEEEKRFMRFGRKDEEMEPAAEKRFMRFGKSHGGSDDLGALDYETSGKRFMRFGKRTQEDIDEKRFMRFGKREDDEDEKSEEKRFMRFGKRFMRFGRIPGASNDGLFEPKDMSEEKRFMRFGKRNNIEDLDAVLDSSLLTDDTVKGSDDKRFMRFGKKNDGTSAKRFMRFGKRSNTSE